MRRARTSLAMRMWSHLCHQEVQTACATSLTGPESWQAHHRASIRHLLVQLLCPWINKKMQSARRRCHPLVAMAIPKCQPARLRQAPKSQERQATKATKDPRKAKTANSSIQAQDSCRPPRSYLTPNSTQPSWPGRNGMICRQGRSRQCSRIRTSGSRQWCSRMQWQVIRWEQQVFSSLFLRILVISTATTRLAQVIIG